MANYRNVTPQNPVAYTMGMALGATLASVIINSEADPSDADDYERYQDKFDKLFVDADPDVFIGEAVARKYGVSATLIGKVGAFFPKNPWAAALVLRSLARDSNTAPNNVEMDDRDLRQLAVDIARRSEPTTRRVIAGLVRANRWREAALVLRAVQDNAAAARSRPLRATNARIDTGFRKLGYTMPVLS